MTTWTDFGAEMRDALIAAATADDDIGTAGTLEVATIEEWPAADEVQILLPSQVPYIGIACVGATPALTGTGSYSVQVRLRATCAAHETTATASRELVLAMASRLVKCALDLHGTSPGLSEHQVTVDGEPEVGDPEVDADVRELVQVEVEVGITVWYHQTT
jgi:hypothetical protein